MSNWRAKVFWFSPVALAVAVVGIFAFLFSIEPRSTLVFRAFDIGQGDALFIETPDRYQILIDGGTDNKVLDKLGRAMSFWDRSIDLVVLTHPHADHVSGLADVLKRYRVGAIVESGANYSTAEYAEWNRLKEAEHIPVYVAHAGMAVRVGDYVMLRALTPLYAASGQSFKNVHDANVTTELFFGRKSFLLMGDAEDELERALMSRGAISHADVLKVGHHGSRTSSSVPFLGIVRPELAVISVGARNRYGHPHQEILDRLQAVGAKILRTDRDGDIEIISDGVSVAVRR